MSLAASAAKNIILLLLCLSCLPCLSPQALQGLSSYCYCACPAYHVSRRKHCKDYHPIAIVLVLPTMSLAASAARIIIVTPIYPHPYWCLRLPLSIVIDSSYAALMHRIHFYLNFHTSTQLCSNMPAVVWWCRCWDWWGYTGSNYGWQSAVQVTFVRNLIKAVAGY